MPLRVWLPFGGVPEIAPAELAEALEGPTPPLLLDVRTAAEHRGGHIRGAVSTPITSFARRLAGLRLEPQRPVVVICFSAHRSIPAVRILLQEGFQAAQLAGGMRAWRAAGLPEEKA